jgi:hypothetical protein
MLVSRIRRIAEPVDSGVVPRNALSTPRAGRVALPPSLALRAKHPIKIPTLRLAITAALLALSVSAVFAQGAMSAASAPNSAHASR